MDAQLWGIECSFKVQTFRFNDSSFISSDIQKCNFVVSLLTQMYGFGSMLKACCYYSRVLKLKLKLNLWVTSTSRSKFRKVHGSRSKNSVQDPKFRFESQIKNPMDVMKWFH